jgi:hypothetical protein
MFNWALANFPQQFFFIFFSSPQAKRSYQFLNIFSLILNLLRLKNIADHFQWIIINFA